MTHAHSTAAALRVNCRMTAAVGPAVREAGTGQYRNIARLFCNWWATRASSSAAEAVFEAA